MVILLKTASVWVSSIQIIQVRVQNKCKSVWKSRYNGDISATRAASTAQCSARARRASAVGTVEQQGSHEVGGRAPTLVDRWWGP